MLFTRFSLRVQHMIFASQCIWCVMRTSLNLWYLTWISSFMHLTTGSLLYVWFVTNTSQCTCIVPTTQDFNYISEPDSKQGHRRYWDTCIGHTWMISLWILSILLPIITYSCHSTWDTCLGQTWMSDFINNVHIIMAPPALWLLHCVINV